MKKKVAVITSFPALKKQNEKKILEAVNKIKSKNAFCRLIKDLIKIK